ncbi:hypothetical protein [Jeotgalibacillus sp. R-1-5s-1]|uniref:hypothetical protein n=1 Tax=Jeotgalibacillus sp. R-1-5s-1 TaxID=2555897 RepID=UPI001068FED5|nr:hypothetical protein [Jeotgalibacillus sp. R-1-5s-1]TFD92852.1 hypothetical protein E2491_14925 [Jeotgalibacillus sp. R-1-5s-1]
MRKRTAVVIGAETAVGKELVKELCSREEYAEVIALLYQRIEFEHSKLSKRLIDFRFLEARHIGLVEDVFFCVQANDWKKGDYDPVKTAAAAKKCNIQQFIVISSMSANPRSLFRSGRMHGMMEEQLKQLALPSLLIVRPSILLNDPEEYKVSEAPAARLSSFAGWAMQGPLKSYKGIRASQVALAMTEKALTKDYPKYAIYKSGEIENIKRGENKT